MLFIYLSIYIIIPIYDDKIGGWYESVMEHIAVCPLGVGIEPIMGHLDGLAGVVVHWWFIALDHVQQDVPTSLTGFLELAQFIHSSGHVLHGFLAAVAQLGLHQLNKLAAAVVLAQSLWDVPQVLHIHVADERGDVRAHVCFQPVGVDPEFRGAGVEIGCSLGCEMAAMLNIVDAAGGVSAEGRSKLGELGGDEGSMRALGVAGEEGDGGVEGLEGIDVVDAGFGGVGEEDRVGGDADEDEVVGLGEPGRTDGLREVF